MDTVIWSIPKGIVLLYEHISDLIGFVMGLTALALFIAWMVLVIMLFR